MRKKSQADARIAFAIGQVDAATTIGKMLRRPYHRRSAEELHRSDHQKVQDDLCIHRVGLAPAVAQSLACPGNPDPSVVRAC